MKNDGESKALVPADSKALPTDVGARPVVPALITGAGEQASPSFLDFFAAPTRNKNTRQAYYLAVTRFIAWCDRHKIGELADIEPLHVAAYVEGFGKDFEKPTV